VHATSNNNNSRRPGMIYIASKRSIMLRHRSRQVTSFQLSVAFIMLVRPSVSHLTSRPLSYNHAN